MITTLPICFYPMRKIILDDDNAFSQSILLKMHEKNLMSLDSPIAALNYLQHEYKPFLTKADLITPDSQIINSSTKHIINIYIEKLKKMLTKTIYNDISVLFVDYHMPEMLGTEFLKKIQHLSFKKALITGENDYKIGIDAFNSGLVDAYLRKDDPGFSTKIQTLISDLEWKYFTDLSNFIYDLPDFDYLKNINFINAFKQYIKTNDITAFCLSHTQGNFIMQNNKGEQKNVIVRNKSQLKELARIAEEDGASLETIKNLNQGKVIPFFGTREYWEVPANEWDHFLHPVKNGYDDSNLMWAEVNM